MAVSSTVAAMVETMERWLTPAEFVGALKLGVALHNASGRTGPGAKHYERAAWYQARLVEFMKRTGFVEIEPSPVAQAFCDAAKAEEQEAIDKATGRLDAEPIDLPALPRVDTSGFDAALEHVRREMTLPLNPQNVGA